MYKVFWLNSKRIARQKSWIYPLLGLAFVFLVFWYFGKKAFNAASAALSEVGSTLTNVELDSMISKLEYLVRGITTDNHESQIIDLLKGLSLPDYNKLSNRFGKRWYSKALKDWGIPFISSYLNLTEVLALELDDWAKQALANEAPHLTLF